jgi:hypothetical protein
MANGHRDRGCCVGRGRWPKPAALFRGSSKPFYNARAGLSKILLKATVISNKQAAEAAVDTTWDGILLSQL